MLSGAVFQIVCHPLIESLSCLCPQFASFFIEFIVVNLMAVTMIVIDFMAFMIIIATVPTTAKYLLSFTSLMKIDSL